MKFKAALFDADGVLTLPEEMFSVMYARSRGLDAEAFSHFFRDSWPTIVTGKKDLKEAIREDPELWRWEGSIDELLAYWFKTEDVQNEALLALIQKARSSGLPCYLATDQERYRGEYVKDVMFKDKFDGYFISAELGVTKTDQKFFELVIEQLRNDHPGLRPEEVIFFDDSQAKVDTARAVGISGHVYTGLPSVTNVLG